MCYHIYIKKIRKGEIIVSYKKLSLDVLNGDVFASVIVKFKEEIGILMEEMGKKDCLRRMG